MTVGRPAVLVVDDDSVLAETIAAILADDYDVVTCGSGQQALQLFDPERFLVVIVDYLMPEMSGTELLARLMLRSSGTCWLLMTAAEDFYATAPSMGQQRPPVIFKPFDPDKFQKTVAHLCRIAKMKRSTQALQSKVGLGQGDVRVSTAGVGARLRRYRS